MRLVLVTGMHRAGTSLTARVLGLLGARLGPDEMMMPPTEDNPRGYWELADVAALDEELLERHAGRWHRLPGLPDTWAFDRDLERHRERAREVLRAAFGTDAFAATDGTPTPGSPDGGDVAAMKDPRLAVVQSFWRTVTEVDRTVLPLRRPDEVVGSLVKRDDLPPAKAAGLWTDHVTAALAHDPDALVSTFDAMLADPVAEAERLAAFVGLPAPTGEVADAIEAFRDRGLQRNADFDAGDNRELRTARALYDALTAAGPDAPVPADAITLATQLWHDRNDRRVWEDRHRDAMRELEPLRRRVEELAPYPDRARAAESALGRTKNELRHARRAAERWEDEYQRLANRKVVKAALGAAELAKPAIRKARELRGVDPTGRATPGAAGRDREQPKARPHVPATPAEAEALQQRLVADAPKVAAPADAPHVTIAMLTRDGLHHLRTCLPALAATQYPSLDLVVVDNASSDGSVAYLEQFAAEAPFDVTIVRNTENATFSAGNNQAIAATAEGRTGDDLVLLLNNDIEPVEPHWLARMVATLRDRDAAAVGARLVYPRREGLDNAGDLTFPDLSLQHRGLAFEAPFDGVPRGRNLGAGDDPLDALATRVGPAAGATAACLLLRRDVLDEVDGLTEDYVYGTEDVELCLKVRAGGHEIVYDGQVVCWHHEYGTQNAAGRDAKRRNRLHNREVFVDSWGPRLFRELLLDKLGANAPTDPDGNPEPHVRVFSEEPLHVAITVTKDDESAGYGDWYTAHQFGDALEALGWRVSYAERYGDRWYDLDPSVDVLVAMIDAIDLTRVPRHVVTCAWVRNWPQRWLSHDWIDDYDLVFASSQALRDVIEANTVHTCIPLALAADGDLFHPEADGTPDGHRDRADVLFVGSRHDKPRVVEEAFAPLAAAMDLELHGHGWEKSPSAATLTRGPLPYRELPAAYASVPLVIDDTVGEATRKFHAVNSRVFEAIAAGAVPITDNPIGVAELFETPVPSWDEPEQLVEVCKRWLDDDAGRRELAAKLREELVEKHTYAHRAAEFRDALRAWVEAKRFTVLVGIPDREQAPAWGDWHYARDVQRELNAAGHPTRVALLPEWEQAWISQADATIHLFGLSEHRPRRGQVNVLWNISHPEKVDVDLVERYDLACIASTTFARQLAAEAPTTPVHPLLQATDHRRMHPDTSGPPHELLFVGNSRRVRRRIVDDVQAAGLGDHLAIYGRDWTKDLVDMSCVKGEHVDNRDLSAWYGSAKVVLNDHWDGMRQHGFLSNRLFDALACGAFVLSDHVDGIDEVFDGAVETYTDVADLKAKATRWLEDEAGRRERAEKGRAIVLERHTFEARVRELLDLVLPLVEARPARVLPVGADGRVTTTATAGAVR